MKQSPSPQHGLLRPQFVNSRNYGLNGAGPSSHGGIGAMSPPLLPQPPLMPSFPVPQVPHGNVYLHRVNDLPARDPGDYLPPVETVVARLETACILLHGVGMNQTKVAEIASEIQILSDELRRVGPQLELAYPDMLDRVISSMRDASAQTSLPSYLRLAIFELVELRAAKWMLPQDSSNYYRQRRTGQDEDEGSDDASTSASPLDKQDTKTYREEILIKNSDSGKVNASAKERVLSINGYSQQSINMAKALIHETIARNASPVFDQSASVGDVATGTAVAPTAMANANVGLEDLDNIDHDPPPTTNLCHFSYTISVNDELIKVSGSSFHLVQEAKVVLDEHFASDRRMFAEIVKPPTPPVPHDFVPFERFMKASKPPKRITYTRNALMEIGNLVQKAGTKPVFPGLDQRTLDSLLRKNSTHNVKTRNAKDSKSAS